MQLLLNFAKKRGKKGQCHGKKLLDETLKKQREKTTNDLRDKKTLKMEIYIKVQLKICTVDKLEIQIFHLMKGNLRDN